MKQRKNNKEVICIFMRFLKENGVYEQYVQHMNDYIIQMQKIYNHKFPSNLCGLLEISRLTTRYIIDYFTWSTTNEGKKYWIGIHLKWLYMCQNKPELLNVSSATQQDLPDVIKEWISTYETTKAI